MSVAISVEFEFYDAETIMHLSGTIDASIEKVMKNAKGKVKHPRLTLNCKNIKHVCSDGIVPWMNGLEFLKDKLDVKLERCSQEFFLHAQMIPQFTRDIAIRSFYSQVTCAFCDADGSVLIELIDDHPIFVEDESCSKCGQPYPPLRA